uniref:USP domain-containing protein n=1 Tax=Strigops habroptila TaxID=2489341 RepID=A0A672V554_STRHB
MRVCSSAVIKRGKDLPPAPPCPGQAPVCPSTLRPQDLVSPDSVFWGVRSALEDEPLPCAHLACLRSGSGQPGWRWVQALPCCLEACTCPWGWQRIHEPAGAHASGAAAWGLLGQGLWRPPGGCYHHSFSSSLNPPASGRSSGPRGRDPCAPEGALPHGALCMKWEKVHRISAGLHHLGNMCFLNSTVQCLTYTPPLGSYLLSKEHSCDQSSFCMICIIQNHVAQAFANSGSVTEPTAFVRDLEKRPQHMRFGQQEDVHEFLRYTIEATHLLATLAVPVHSGIASLPLCQAVGPGAPIPGLKLGTMAGAGWCARVCSLLFPLQWSVCHARASRTLANLFWTWCWRSGYCGEPGIQYLSSPGAKFLLSAAT